MWTAEPALLSVCPLILTARQNSLSNEQPMSSGAQLAAHGLYESSKLIVRLT